MNNFERIAKEIGELTAKKNIAYGDSTAKTGELLRVFFPNGVGVEHLYNMQLFARIFDKLFRIVSDPDAFGEDPWRDVAGYALLAAERNDRMRAERTGIGSMPIHPDSPQINPGDMVAWAEHNGVPCAIKATGLPALAVDTDGKLRMVDKSQL